MVGQGIIYTRQQKRGYHRALTCLQYWHSNGYQVLWVALTTSKGGNSNDLAYNHQRLRQRIEVKHGYKTIQHFQIRTSEGNGTIHTFWAWRNQPGMKQRLFYIKQAWLSDEWQRIHGAKIVWIKKVDNSRKSRANLTRYCMSQYCSNQSGYEHMSWSWGRIFGFPLVKCWRVIKYLRNLLNPDEDKIKLFEFWRGFLEGSRVNFNDDYNLSIDEVRQVYKTSRAILPDRFHKLDIDLSEFIKSSSIFKPITDFKYLID